MLEKDAGILILDPCFAKDLTNTLREILETSFDTEIRVTELAHAHVRESTWRDQVSVTISSFLPKLIFVLIPSTYIGRLNNMIRFIKSEFFQSKIIVVTEGGRSDDMVELLRFGASDFITTPMRSADVIPRIWRVLEKKSPQEILVHTLKNKIGLRQLIGGGSAFLAEIEKIPLMANCDAGILISGETGTGKEMCARAIHYLSPRADGPFIPVNCGAIPVELFESELFGHMRGAFTGASTSYSGLIHEAQGGTLFLDDINCLSLSAQVKLLRFIQEKEYRQLGSTKTRQVDLRVVTATNVALDQAVREGEFREDLYYRLNVIPLNLPPLRKRKEDIPLLAKHFLKMYASEFNKEIDGFTSEAMQVLLLYEWPGNVRELENIIQRTVIFCEDKTIGDKDILLSGCKVSIYRESFKEAKSRIIDEFEKNYIRRALLAHQGNITKAAISAKKNRRAFWELIRKHKIDAQDFKVYSHE